MSDWYERAIKDEYITSYEYESFENRKYIGKGGFGTVCSAYSEDIDQTIVLKSLNDDLIDENKFHEFVREVKNIIKVHNHINIIKFLGFTKDTTTETGSSYMAKDISNGIKCLHNENIVHRDLHDKNILVNDGRLMIMDFALSLRNTKVDVPPLFSDPEYIINPFLFERRKPSDIYSLGVLFWELSSGVPPFKNIFHPTKIALKVIKGEREEPINGTPIDFMNLYCDAWNGDPNSRPNIDEICHRLNSIQLLPVYNSIKHTPVENNLAIEYENIKTFKTFEYKSFKDWKPLGKGGFGSVYTAYSEVIDQNIALKRLNPERINENSFYEFFREVKNIKKVDHHINIIQFFGITIDATTETEIYYMVLQLANNGDLRSYLRNSFSNLNWSTKIEMAKDISNGIKCLHKADLVHRDLHDNNILVNDGSLGVLFWELSSGVPPFKNLGDINISRKVISGGREAPINGTPIDFLNLYCNAWDDDPKFRPDIDEICNKLNSIQLTPVYNNYY
ncbi:kinase-like domain-containing protein [Gigaspora margarita]|uniref:Kinase-like domain-containing protein n=1 Tax=Gigaspora margarita TaxID=4874 RepID=A0A8H3XG14_GIGMA|nr:kinase-like domain-containing protein [Gigaspora margarita]